MQSILFCHFFSGICVRSKEIWKLYFSFFFRSHGFSYILGRSLNEKHLYVDVDSVSFNWVLPAEYCNSQKWSSRRRTDQLIVAVTNNISIFYWCKYKIEEKMNSIAHVNFVSVIKFVWLKWTRLKCNAGSSEASLRYFTLTALTFMQIPQLGSLKDSWNIR